jgi:nucleoside-diphosphate-sugar epimerase
MHTILGANGQIGTELAKALKAEYSDRIRLVSRSPKQVNGTDTLFPADLLDPQKALEAVAGSSVVYFTVGLPMDTALWQAQFGAILDNTIAACLQHGVPLVFFDNTYMLPMDGTPLTETTAFTPHGPKAQVRAEMANSVLTAMRERGLKAVICRAPEFYGPGKTQSITNSTVFANIKKGKKPKVLRNDTALRSLIYTPDAARAMALIGHTPSAYGQTWNLPCADPITYKTLIAIAERVVGRPLPYTVVPHWMLFLMGIWKKPFREIRELLPRYAQDNIFVTDKFKQAFPDFEVTSFERGVEVILKGRV